MDENNIYIKIFNVIKNKVEKDSLKNVVIGAVANQVDANFHIELLKAQAVIARTLIIRRARAFGGKGCSEHKNCDICNGEHCIRLYKLSELRKVWKEDYNVNFKKIDKAVEETSGLIMVFNNKPIEPKYHDTCGGSTENSEMVIDNKVVYLRKVLCNYCKDSPNWAGYKEIPIEEIEKKLKIKFPKPNTDYVTNITGFIEDVNKDDEGRVISLTIGGKKFKGRDVARLLDLDSTRFSIIPTKIGVATIGKGHGLGLCQYGGNKMAEVGYTFKDILNYYFTGIDIKKVHMPSVEKPLCGRIIVLDPGHGGENGDDVYGPGGLREKDVVLDIALKLEKKLTKLGANVHLTRREDEYLHLSKRADITNKIKPDFFISLHMNSYNNPAIKGYEAYYFRGDGDSETLGKLIASKLEQKCGIVNRGVKNGDFFLLREVTSNALIIEIDYITNPLQELKLQDESYKNKVSDSILEGIVEYYKY